MKRLLIAALSVFAVGYASSEDIELYIGDVAQRTGNRPQVLIIFDNSGSMRREETVKEPYNPNKNYPAVNGFSKLSDEYIYYTKGGGLDNSNLSPDDPNEARKFLAAINSCATAKERLASVGFYTGRIREYTFEGNSGSWQEIPETSGEAIRIIDCEDDVKQVPNDPEKNAGVLLDNGSIQSLPDGYPIDGLGSQDSPIYYTSSAGNSNVVWVGEVVTLYTDNYLRWSHNDDIRTVDRTRLDIAKDTVTDLIESAPSIDFGLQIFNLNYPREGDRDGGRVIMGIQEMTADARSNLLDIIDLEIDAETNTPLCETLYEARRYFGGLSVDYGDDDTNYSWWYQGNTPPYDESIIESGNYITPFSNCSNQVYVILITDGTPTVDTDANGYVSSLPDIGSPFRINGRDNYLAALAGWMNTHDLNSNLEGEQTSTLFTIGFGRDAINDAGELLREAARLGGGEYYPADDPSSLLSSLQSALALISRVNATFTAPSVATNNFDKTETLDAVYYAMFLPDRGPRWQGNLKKLKVVGAEQFDRDGNPAIDVVTGNILDTAKTFWSTSSSPDGNNVEEGGVAEMLRNKSHRVVYSDFGGATGFKLLTTNNAITAFGSTSNLANEMGISETKIDDYLDWAKGKDLDDADADGSTNDMRPDVFADPLHSKPLVINYGGSPTQDIRIIVGTNAGVLHMFQDYGDTVDENWAFMPKEFFKNIKKLRDNYTSTSKVYGIDGSATAYILDKNGDGIVSSAQGDKAWIFIGLRRGGDSYYAIDISEPNTPKLMWHIDSSSTGFSELGQTWSQPKIGYSKLNIVSGTAKPVLFFAGGYAISKDADSVGSDDSVGRAIYMVDAETGNLLWSAAPSGATTSFAGTDSIVSPVAILDSNEDGLTDRLYVGDTGGNIWRVDMPSDNPSSSTEPWTVFKLAELGGITLADDRRFFSEPSIVRTIISDTLETTTIDVDGNTTTMITRQERPYDAILIGSGDRTSPLSTDTQNKLFMIRDKNIFSQSFTGSETAPIPNAITIDDLYDYTDNPFDQTMSTLEKEALEVAVSNKSGWFIDLTGSGEKSTASAIAIEGVAYFTSFQPATNSESSCQIDPVTGFLYAVDLTLGRTVYSWNNRKILETTGTIERPQIIITQDTDPTGGAPGGGTGEDAVKTNATIKILAGRIIVPLGITIDTWRTYIYITE